MLKEKSLLLMCNLLPSPCSVFLKALRHFAHTIQDKFSSPFEIEVRIVFHFELSFVSLARLTFCHNFLGTIKGEG